MSKFERAKIFGVALQKGKGCHSRPITEPFHPLSDTAHGQRMTFLSFALVPAHYHDIT